MFGFDLNVTGDGGDKIGEEFFATDVTGGKITGEYFGLSKVCPAVFSSAKKLNEILLFQKRQFQNQSD